MPNFQGVWSLSEQYQNAGIWPSPPQYVLFAGGFSPATNTIQQFDAASGGTATDFGDLTVARWGGAGLSSTTRGIFASGDSGTGNSFTNVIDFVTLASAGNASDFGDLSIELRGNMAGLASSTRGIIAGGSNDTSPTYYNVISYITTASAGNASDFGDLTTGRRATGSASSTRGLISGDFNGSAVDVIDYVSIESAGNAIDFGDLTAGRYSLAAVASATRSVAGGGYDGSVQTNIMDYVTIASAGNATDFGDLTVAVNERAGAATLTTGLFAGGTSSTYVR
jgi:hypothetical protein